MPKPRWKTAPPNVDVESIRQQKLYHRERGTDWNSTYNQRDDTRLPGHAFLFSWDDLQTLDDNCYLVALNGRSIAWLEHIVNTFFREDWYSEPQYIADIWKVDVEGPEWVEIRDFMEEVAHCLMTGCNVSELNDSVKEIATIMKYIHASMADGVVRDHYHDPARPQDFADAVGVDVADIPKYDWSAWVSGAWSWDDLGWPNLSAFDELGTNRQFIENVPSTQIVDGADFGTDIANKSVATMMGETFYASNTRLTEFLTIGNYNWGYSGLADVVKQAETALRHLDAKFSRDGIVRMNLPDGVTWSQYPIELPNWQSIANWMLGQHFTSPSVFTYDRARLYANEWLVSALIESLRAGVLPGVNLASYLPMSQPFYISGSYGRGIADLLKGPEPSISYGKITVPIIGEVEITYSNKYYRANGIPIVSKMGMPASLGSIATKLSMPEGESIWTMLNRTFNLSDDDPNLRTDIQSTAQILNKMQFTVNVEDENGNQTPLDLTPLITALGEIANGFDTLDKAGKRDSETIALAIAKLENKIAELAAMLEKKDMVSIAVANTGEHANILAGAKIPPNAELLQGVTT